MQKANAKYPAYIRIDKSKILILNTVIKLMLKSAKRTVQRQATLRLYEDEINTLYKQ